MALTDKDRHELSAMRGRVADAARRITGAPGQPGGPPLAEGIRKGPWAPGGVGDVQRIWVDHRTIEDRNMLHVSESNLRAGNPIGDPMVYAPNATGNPEIRTELPQGKWLKPEAMSFSRNGILDDMPHVPESNLKRPDKMFADPEAQIEYQREKLGEHSARMASLDQSYDCLEMLIAYHPMIQSERDALYAAMGALRTIRARHG